MKIIKKRIITLALCFALVFLIGGELVFNAFTVKASAETVTSYDNTRIEDDIAHLDFTHYVQNSNGKCEVIYFTEYCYSTNSDVSPKYGLYVYIYNPTERAIDENAGMNKVEMAVEYNENGEAVGYDKISLEFLDKTENNRFYKFKLSESQRLLSIAYRYASDHDGVRKYELIKTEIKHGSVITSNGPSKVYEFSGYGAYCDKDRTPISTLTCKDYGARSIYLSLDHTNYRFEDKGDNLKDELNSVYFSVSDSYIQEFGNLEKINAEWYEYKTKYMFVTSDDGAYKGLWDMRNIRVNEFSKMIDDSGNVLSDELTRWRVYWEGMTGVPGDADGVYQFYKTYCGKSNNADIDNDRLIDGGILNPDDQSNLYGFADGWECINYLNWLFHVEDVTGKDRYRVPGEDVKKYMEEYTKDFPNDTRILGKYASSLFEASIDENRKRFLYDENASCGYVNMEFTASDNFDINAGTSQSIWNRLWFGTKYENVTYSPIVTLTSGDVKLSDEAFSKKFYVGEEDVARIKLNATKDLNDGKVPVLLRFAVTDYYSSTAHFDYAEENAFEMSGEDGYVAQQTVFLNFDVISLTFKSADGYKETVIGVVSDPIDIINGLTPPDGLVEDQNWFRIIVGLVLLFFVIIIFREPLGKLLHNAFEGISVAASGVIWFVTWPFRALFGTRNRRRK
ncbi:MAG: hypothetical protein E7612_09220 [Ruminococcaceae bacterium]|nr:hypothetical protein [Oscillospiraceae bacterium]